MKCCAISFYLIAFILPLHASDHSVADIIIAKKDKLSEILREWTKLNKLSRAFCYASISGWSDEAILIGSTEGDSSNPKQSILLKITSQNPRKGQIECAVQSNDPELKGKFQKILSANVWSLPKSKSANVPKSGITSTIDTGDTILIKIDIGSISALTRSASLAKYTEPEIQSLEAVFWEIIEHYIPTRWDRSSYQTGLSAYEGIPNSASDITIFEDRNMGNKGIFLADFKIAESDFVRFASKKGWTLKPIKQPEYLSSAKGFQDNRSSAQKEIKDGLYSYFKSDSDDAHVTAAYDRTASRGYIESSLILTPFFGQKNLQPEKEDTEKEH